MDDGQKIQATCLTPILYVRDFSEAIRYYTEKLLFRKLWDWGSPPSFGAIGLGKVEIFLCLEGQGQPGSWLWIALDDVDDYFTRIAKLGADIVEPPTDRPWGMREMHVRDPNQHVIRFGHGIPMREPKIAVERVPVEARVEKRLAALLGDLARHKQMTLGEMLEEMALHSFEEMHGGDAANPHTRRTLSLIRELRKKHGIDYDCHANYRFTEANKSAPPA